MLHDVRDHTRFLTKVDVDEQTGCWNWTGKTLPSGYGRFWLDGAQRYTHRVAHEFWNGPIGDGLQVDHLCRNTSCCNPQHLEAVTPRVNVLRSTNISAERAQQTACIHGHPFDEENTYTAPNGTRKCMECRRRARNESYARSRHAAA